MLLKVVRKITFQTKGIAKYILKMDKPKTLTKLLLWDGQLLLGNKTTLYEHTIQYIPHVRELKLHVLIAALIHVQFKYLLQLCKNQKYDTIN